MDAFFTENPDGTYELSTGEIESLMHWDLSVIDSERIGELSWEELSLTLNFADGVFYEKRFSTRNFSVAGHWGTYSGSDINYYVVGGVMAARGFSRGMVRDAVIFHNVHDIGQGQPFLHNFGQAFGYDAHYWAQRGWLFYHEHNSTF